MRESTQQAMIEAYVTAFRERDLPQCMSFYSEDATVKFIFGTYRGKQAIEKWHEDRFANDLQLINLENVSVDGETIVVHLHATSRRLKLFGIKSVKGTGTFLIQDGHIKEAKFAPRKGVASHMDWQFR